MAAGGLNDKSLRSTEYLLVWAFAISLALHVVGYGGFAMGHKLGWWNKDLMPSWLKSTKQQIAELQKLHPKPPPPKTEPELTFVEVDPTAAPADAPKDAKYYSSKNSRAANKSAKNDTQTPQIDGSQLHVPSTLDSKPSKAAPLQPTPPKQVAEKPKTQPKPQANPPVGDLAFAKPSPNPTNSEAQPDPQSEPAPPAHVRPRRLSDVVNSQSSANQKVKQEGGLKARLDTDSFDAKATPFGEYDYKLVEAIRSRWLDKLNDKSFSRDGTGHVVVNFRLLSNGQITDVKVSYSGVNDLLTYVCESAIREPAPFEPWPSDMRRYFGADFRDVQFTFWYE